jgi:hypothetical protein
MLLTNLEKKWIQIVGTMTESTMQRECAIIAIIKTAELRSHGIAHMKNYTPTECVKTATLTSTIKWKGKSQEHKNSNIPTYKPKLNRINHDFTLIPLYF